MNQYGGVFFFAGPDKKKQRGDGEMEAKEFLSRAWRIERQVQSRLEQIERLRSLACRVTARFGGAGGGTAVQECDHHAGYDRADYGGGGETEPADR